MTRMFSILKQLWAVLCSHHRGQELTNLKMKRPQKSNAKILNVLKKGFPLNPSKLNPINLHQTDRLLSWPRSCNRDFNSMASREFSRKRFWAWKRKLCRSQNITDKESYKNHTYVTPEARTSITSNIHETSLNEEKSWKWMKFDESLDEGKQFSYVFIMFSSRPPTWRRGPPCGLSCCNAAPRRRCPASRSRCVAWR